MDLRSLGLGFRPPAPAILTAAAKVVVLINIGQSNEKGRNPGLGAGGGIVSGDIAPDARILAWPAAGADVGTLIQAAEPLRYPGTTLPGDPYVGPIMPMAKALLATLGPDDVIIIMPEAFGGTSYLATGEWAVGGSLHNGTISRINTLKPALAAAYPGRSIEWCFSGLAGETDSGYPASTYLAAVLAGLSDIEAQTGISATLVKARMSPAWVSTTVGGNAIDSAQILLRERRARTAIVDSPDGPYDPNTTNIHFNANAQVVRGQRMKAAFATARTRTVAFDAGVNLLDSLSAMPGAGYSTWRRLRAAYSGPALRILRSSDSTTLDVGFDGNGWVSLAAIETFCAGTNGFVDSWYDQTGNGRHFAATGSVTRPQIVTGGILHMRNGRPVMGGNATCGLASAYDPGSAGAFAIAGSFTTDGTRMTFGSRGMQLARLSGAPFMIAAHNAGTVNAGLSVPAGVSTIVGYPATGAQRGWIGGIEQTPLASVATNNSSAVGIMTLLHRQVTAGTVTQADTSLISELILTATAWPDADRAIIHAGMVGKYQTDPMT